MDGIITRFAPSPTGYLHLGGVRTALINYILTYQYKKNNRNSKFLLRIEDTDKKRSKKNFIDSIINGLQWLNIKWDGEIFIQSERLFRHQEIAFKLLEMNSAFKCICSSEEIEKKRKENLKKNISIKRLCNKCEFDPKAQNAKKNYCIRIKVPNSGYLLINDLVQKEVKVNNIEIDNFILLRQDGSPTYMLSVVVDDYDMNINTVIRGNDHMNNTFRQAQIYKHLGWTLPQYGHLPLIHGVDGAKLSKRHGSIDINKFKSDGYLPHAIINNLILLGWSPKNNNEIIMIDEIIKKFDISQLSKSASIFDYQKLDFFNNYYLNKKVNYEYIEQYIKKNLSNKLNLSYNEQTIKNILKVYKSKINNLSSLIKIIEVYTDNDFITKSNKLLNNNFVKITNSFKNKLQNLKNFNLSNIEYCINQLIKEQKISFASFGKPMRLLLTNNQDGPSLALIISILGKKNTFIRINNYINK